MPRLKKVTFITLMCNIKLNSMKMKVKKKNQGRMSRGQMVTRRKEKQRSMKSDFIISFNPNVINNIL